MHLLTLDKIGFLSAILLGIALWGFGEGEGLFFIASMLWFLILAAAVTVVGKKRKKKLRLYQPARGWKNVAANGIVPFAVAVTYYANTILNFISPSILIVAYVASIAAVTADKFGSELGVLGKSKPIMLVTLEPTDIGVSGGITINGLLGGVLGAGLLGIILFWTPHFLFYESIIIITGLFGSLVDSVFGYWENKGYGNKFTSNALGAFFGCALSIIILAVYL